MSPSRMITAPKEQRSETFDVIIPTGNFGNILKLAILPEEMGVPISS